MRKIHHEYRVKTATYLPRGLYKNFIGDFVCLRADQHLIEGSESGGPSTPLACSFSKIQPNLVAVADEDGGILILDSFRLGPDAIQKDWRAHKNAIFDIDWTPGQNRLLTASGDQCIQELDVEAEQAVSTFKGHTATVRTVRCSDDPNIFATGARDGHIMIWDKRVCMKNGSIPPVNMMCNAHSVSQQISSAKKKRTSKAPPVVTNQHTVTAVIFQNEKTLITSGCVDGTVKLWDLRKTYSNLKSEPIPFHKFVYNGTSSRKLGFSSLLLDGSRTRLFANCSDSVIYAYDCAALNNNPVASYKGHTNSSYYVKMALSPNDLFLLSGSSDGHGFIWTVAEPEKKPLVLNCHSDEISGVGWSPVDHSLLMTLSDDCSICTWRAVRPDHLDVWRAKTNASLSHLVGTAEWPSADTAAEAATPLRTGLHMWRTPERQAFTSRPVATSPLVQGVIELSRSPQSNPSPSADIRSPLLSPTKNFGGISEPLASPRKIHVLLSPRKAPVPGYYDALSPRKMPSSSRPATGSASSGGFSKSVKRKLSEIADAEVDVTNRTPGKLICQGLRSGGTPQSKTPQRTLTPSKQFTPDRTCVQNLKFGATPDKLKREFGATPDKLKSPTVNLPNYVLNPEPRTPQPLRENGAPRNQNWLLQLSKQKKEDKQKNLKDSRSPPDNKPKVATPRCFSKTENTPKSQRKTRSTPRSGVKRSDTPKSTSKTPSTPRPGSVEDTSENTPKSSQGSSVKRKGNSFRLSTTKTPTATRRSILSYFSPKDQAKQ